MNFSRRSVLVAGVSAAAGGFSGLSQAHATVVAVQMRCAASYPDQTYHTLCLKGFAEELARTTKGEIAVTVTANQALKKMNEVLPSLKSGDIQLGEVLMSSYSDKMPLLSMDTVPFIVRNWSDARRMWASSRPLVAEGLSKHGALLLYAVPWPPQGLYSTEPVHAFSDLKGKKFRVFNPITRRLCELVGAIPVEVSGKELTVAIAEGRVEAMITSSTTGVDSLAWTKMKFFHDIRAWMPKNMVAMSEATWRTLTREQRAAVDRAAANAEVAGWDMAQKADDASKKILLENGMKIETPGVYLRREMELRGERFGGEFAKKSTENTVALVQYYTTKSS